MYHNIIFHFPARLITPEGGRGDVTMSDASEKYMMGDGSAVIFRLSECDISPGAPTNLEAERQVIHNSLNPDFILTAADKK